MIPFFFVAEYAHTVPSFSIHLLMETQVVSTSWLQCCCEYRGHVFFQTCVFIFFGYIPKTRVAGSCGSSIFSFLRNLHNFFSRVTAPIYSPTKMYKGSLYSTSLPMFQLPLDNDTGFLGFPGGSDDKESFCNTGDASSIPGSRRSPEKAMATHPSVPGESHGQRSLAGYSPWGCKESDVTERLSTHTLAFYQMNLSFKNPITV